MPSVALTSWAIWRAYPSSTSGPLLTLAILSYGGIFELMKDGGDTHVFVKMSTLGIESVVDLLIPFRLPSQRFDRQQEILGTMPWLRAFYRLLPNSGDTMRLRAFAKDTVMKRVAKGSMIRDIFYFLVRSHSFIIGLKLAEFVLLRWMKMVLVERRCHSLFLLPKRVLPSWPVSLHYRCLQCVIVNFNYT